jgi:hypothetical protein
MAFFIVSSSVATEPSAATTCLVLRLEEDARDTTCGGGGGEESLEGDVGSEKLPTTFEEASTIDVDVGCDGEDPTPTSGTVMGEEAGGDGGADVGVKCMLKIIS